MPGPSTLFQPHKSQPEVAADADALRCNSALRSFERRRPDRRTLRRQRSGTISRVHESSLPSLERRRNRSAAITSADIGERYRPAESISRIYLQPIHEAPSPTGRSRRSRRSRTRFIRRRHIRAICRGSRFASVKPRTRNVSSLLRSLPERRGGRECSRVRAWIPEPRL